MSEAMKYIAAGMVFVILMNCVAILDKLDKVQFTLDGMRAERIEANEPVNAPDAPIKYEEFFNVAP